MVAIRRLFFGTTTNSADDRVRSHFVRSIIALAAGSALLAGTAARADDLASTETTLLATGGVYGGITQRLSVCYAFNAGTSTVSEASLTIRNQVGGAIGKTRCAVAAGTLCAVVVNVVSTMAYSCTITSTSTNAANLRGVLDFRDATGNVLINSNLH
jgi:hypothetical protein